MKQHLHLYQWSLATVVAPLRLRLLCIALLSLLSASYVHAENDLTSVDQIEEGKWYRISTNSHSFYLEYKNSGQIFERDYRRIYSYAGGADIWTFEKTDDGHYYLHNFYGIYISAYSTAYSSTNGHVISGTRADAAKLNVSYVNGAFRIQKASDSKYLTLSVSTVRILWSDDNDSDGSNLAVTEVKPDTITNHWEATHKSCQLQEGEKIKLLPSFSSTEIFQFQWKSNNEAVATVDSCGMVRALKEGMTIITLTNKITGETNFTHVTVKNNPCDHEYDPYHDIMIKYEDASGSMFFGPGYERFYAENSFDLYIDGVKRNPELTNCYFNDTYISAFMAYLDYCGIHTVMIVPESPITTIPESLFCERIDAPHSGDEQAENIYYGYSIVELRLPCTISTIGNYNGVFCPNLRDIYYYYKSDSLNVANEIFPSNKAFSSFDGYCGSAIYGEKNLHVNSDTPASILMNEGMYSLYEPGSSGCGFQIKAIDNPDQKVWIEGKDKKMLLGKSWSVSHTPDYIDLKYTLSDESILSRDSRDIFTGVKLGKTTVTVGAADGSPVVKTFEVEVVDDLNPIKVETITISPSELTLNTNQISTLTATCLPENANNKIVKWSSSDNNIAIVSDGTVAALAEGTATITATAVDGSGTTGACKVTVIKEDSGIDNIDGGQQLKIILTDNRLSVVGLASNVPISVSSVQGCLVYQGTEHTCTLPGAGIYIVKAKGEKTKVAVK